jgi:signal transduction histidine kinase
MTGTSVGAAAILRTITLFDGITDKQLTELIQAGDVLTFDSGDVMFQEAQPADFWWVLLSGKIELVRHAGHEDSVIGAMTAPGQWAGGFRAWDPHGVYLATGRCSGPSEVLRVPAGDLGDLANSWFPFGVHLIKGLTQTVRSIESMARQRESLVALGTLAAGLAHEINNPASVSARAVDALTETSEAMMSAFGRLAAQSISPNQFLALDTLRQQTGPPVADFSPLALAAREDELSDWLVEHNIDRDWLIAPALAAAGIDIAWCDKVADVLDGDALGPGLEWLAGSFSMSGLLAEVKESTGRISELVAVVKSYSQMDRATVQSTDIREGLESTLAVLAHQVNGGITIKREYANDVPRIQANAAELNQVWTNLIKNAIDAMDSSGTLRVSIGVEDSVVVVEIGDTGTGMTRDVQAHAFDPFFTTKGVGKGTGLGLDISRRIVVERHGGEIWIEIRPGETVLRVRLPLRPEKSP